jgi:hypothetical protein
MSSLRRPQIIAALDVQTTNTTDMFCLMAGIMYANETVSTSSVRAHRVCVELRRGIAYTASSRRCSGMLRTRRAVYAEDQSRRLGTVRVDTYLLLSDTHITIYRKEVKRMQEIDEDATITQLALAWTNMVVVGLAVVFWQT